MRSSENYNSWSLDSINIIDYEQLCLKTAYLKAPNIKESILSLEASAKECKSIADRNGVEYINYPLFQFLKDMIMTIPFNKKILEALVDINYCLYQGRYFGNFKDVLINEYMLRMKKTLLTLQISKELRRKSSSNSLQAHTILKKFLKVFHILKPDPELCFENLEQYEFLAELLKICYFVNVQNSNMVVSLLKLAIDRSVSKSSGLTHVRQPHYPQEFFNYILKHVTSAKFDLVQYCSDHPQTLWEYATSFSVANAAAFGDAERVLSLLQYGFNIFPDNELQHSGHGHPHVNEILSRMNSMVLHIMSKMRLVNCFTSLVSPESGYYIATTEQKECFKLIWRSLSKPYVRRSQLALDISTEYFYLALHAVFKPFRHNRNIRLGSMYETSFGDMANGLHEPRTLKHLCRCTIREKLHLMWNLPHGVFSLQLPKSLERYLNLEYD